MNNPKVYLFKTKKGAWQAEVVGTTEGGLKTHAKTEPQYTEFGDDPDASMRGGTLREIEHFHPDVSF